MYLIFETNGKVKAARRTTRLDAELTRSQLTKLFPGRTVLSPLERPTGPVQVVTVYLSRERNGIGRLSALEQWGIE